MLYKFVNVPYSTVKFISIHSVQQLRITLGVVFSPLFPIHCKFITFVNFVIACKCFTFHIYVLYPHMLKIKCSLGFHRRLYQFVSTYCTKATVLYCNSHFLLEYLKVRFSFSWKCPHCHGYRYQLTFALLLYMYICDLEIWYLINDIVWKKYIYHISAQFDISWL